MDEKDNLNTGYDDLLNTLAYDKTDPIDPPDPAQFQADRQGAAQPFGNGLNTDQPFGNGLNTDQPLGNGLNTDQPFGNGQFAAQPFPQQPAEDILTAEDYALLEEQRNKRTIWDNWIVLGIKAFILMNVGELLFSLPLGILIAVLYLNGSSLIKEDLFNTALTGNYFTSGFLNTCMLYIVFIGIWVVSLIWFAVRKKNRPLFKALTPYTRGNNIKKFGIGLLMGAGMNGFCILLAWLHGDIALSYSCFEFLPLFALLVSVLIQSSAEELICRCYFYQKLIKAYKNPRFAIIVNAVFFGALHLANNGIGILPVLDIITSGLLFSLIVYYMDSFWAASACHMAWNYTQNIIFGLPNSGNLTEYSIFTLNVDTDRSSLFYDTGFGIEGSVMSILVQAVMILLIWLYYRNKDVTPTDIWA